MRHFSVGHLVPDQLDPGRAQSLMPPRKADISPEQKCLGLVHCLLPQALRSGEGLQREAVLQQSWTRWECISRVTKATETSICPSWRCRVGGSAPREEISH